MKTVLFIDYFFPPLAADWRGLAFVKLLPEFGWQPIVVSADESVTYDKDYSLLSQIPKDARVHRVGHKEPSKAWRHARKRLKTDVDFPDYYKSWYGPARVEARKILKNEKVDLLYSASPTFTTAFVAMQLKKEFGVPWVADFLDGWAVNDFLNRSLDASLLPPLRQLHRWRIRRGEERILRSADRAVVISWHVKERLCELYGIEEDRIEVITDGYDESVFSSLKPRSACSDRLTVTFLGSFYPPFTEAIRTFLKVVKDVDERAEVLFIGRAAMPIHAMSMPNVTCILNLPREKALAYGFGSDFLFAVMPPFAKWIPTKTYDYLRLGRPILALVPEDGDTARIVKDARAGFILSFDEDQMREQMRTIFGKQRQGELETFRPDQEYVAQFERRKLTERMARVFNQVAS